MSENTIEFLVGCAILDFGMFWLSASFGYLLPSGSSGPSIYTSWQKRP
ncbi:MAG: hypothetical protein ACYCZB_02140 [Acidiphilium sp.]